MEVSLRLDSSLVVGLVAGSALGVALSSHVQNGGLNWVGAAICPYLWIDTKSQSGKSCCSGKSSSSTGAKIVASDEKEDGGEERAPERDAFWFTEGLTEVFKTSLVLKSILFDARSDFQRVQVIETEEFGKTLVMDGQTQSAKRDEHVYHESLVHPAMLLHNCPRSVFIAGGGEFATAREVLRHNTVERVVMVDIDQVACDICRKELPEWNDGAYEDARFHCEYMDAKKWLEDNDETFDVIIMDICDPIEAGPAYKLYTQEFFKFLQTKLNPGGMFVTQSSCCAIYNAKEECFTVIHNTLASAFDVVIPYAVDVPSFGCNWGFNLAFSANDPIAAKKSVINTDIDKINHTIENRIFGGSAKLKFMDGISFRGILGLPKEIRQSCESEDRVMTMDNPVFMYAG